jgi:1-acyl-sn-glycerol-3-phosphate acyltransferase
LAKRFLRFLFCNIIRLLFFLLTRIHVIGRDNIPPQGGFIAAANHLSILEVPLVYCLIDRPEVTGLIAKKHQKNAFFRWVVNTLEGIWLSREEIDTRALRAARDHLRGGGVLGIAPEGTRSHTGGLIQAKTGVAYLADQAGVPILPVGVSGTWQKTKDILFLRRPKITVNFGEPFTLPPIDRKDRDLGLNQNTDEIMCRIAALLPAEYRGEYAEYPRVSELIRLHETA